MKIKNLTCLFISLFVVIYSNSCTPPTVSSLPNPMGRVGEMIIVAPEYIWKSPIGDSIRSYFSEPDMGIRLPAPEPAYSYSYQTKLTGSTQRFRNIVIINVDMGFEKTKVELRTNAHAQNQLIFNIEAPSADSALSCIARSKDYIVSRFLTNDRTATIEDYKRANAKKIVDKLHEKFQVEMIIPHSYSIQVEKDNFIWIGREERERNWYILVWKDPYLRTTQLHPDSLIFRMNAMTRMHVPGPTPGSYMADEPMVIPAIKRFEKDGIYTVQINGLWQTEKSYMGGPYVNHTIVDTQRGQMVTGIGFVFYPNRDKRQMVRQLEAILYTMIPAE